MSLKDIVAQEVGQEFEKELQKAYSAIFKIVAEKNKELKDVIENFVSMDVIPVLTSQMQELDLDAREDAESFSFISAFVERLRNYSDCVKLVYQKNAFGLQIHPKGKSTYIDLEYGTPYTDTFAHVHLVEEFVQKCAHEVNKVQGILGLPFRIEKVPF